MRRSPSKTRIRCATVSTIDTCLEPIVKVRHQRSRPRSAVTATRVPADQYDTGRQCTSLAANQCHAPRTAGTEVTRM